MKKTTIDTSLLPNMWLTWETTKGVFYLNCSTGKKQMEIPENIGYNKPDRLINSGSKPRYGYAKYHEDLEMLELAEVTIETTRKEEPKQWKYAGEKYFMKKDKTILDENGKVTDGPFNLSRYHLAYRFKDFLGMFYRIGYYRNITEFKKFLGSDTYTVGSGRVVTVNSTWQIQEWYKTKQRVRGEGKQQKLTNKLTDMAVANIDELVAKYPSNNHDNRYQSIIHFERLNDGWSVLRIFNRNGTGLSERERMYLHDDGANRIVAPSKDGWVPARQTHTWGQHELVNKQEAMEQCKRLKYILPLIESESNQSIRNSLITILRFPELEQMINLGYKKAAMQIAHSTVPRADLKLMFGDCYNDKENSILRKAGLTKHQMDKYMSVYEDSGYYYNRCATALREMRKMFGDGLIHLDNTSFDEYYDGFIEMARSYSKEVYPQLEGLNIDRVKFIKNAIRLGKKYDNVYTILNDTLNRYCALNHGTHPEINWYFDSYSDLVRAHNAIDELKRSQDDERRAMWNMEAAERRKKEEKKRIELDKERKVYEYEDDTYVVRLPKDSNEIVREGSLQRICIGGYTTRHALGQTNLFFLRRKSEPDVPFYAIEMDNSKRIVQIHGYCNSWLGNNPEAIPTVVRWLRKNGIKCDEKILTCKAKGYGAINDYVPMPVVD
jgi:hypothetical protein